MCFWGLNAVWAQRVFLSDKANDLYRFDPSACKVERVCHLKTEAFNPAGKILDLALHPDGQLYALEDDGQLFRVDTISGNLTLEHAFENKGQWNALHIDTSGTFFLARQTEVPQEGDLWIYIPEKNYLLRRGSLRRPSGDLCQYGYFLVMAGTARQISDVSSQNNLTHSALLDYAVEGQVEALFPYEAGCDGTLLMGVTNQGIVYRMDANRKATKRLCALPIQVTGAAASPWAGLQRRLPLSIQAITAQSAACEIATGSLLIHAREGHLPLSFAIEGRIAQPDSLFGALSAGFYRVTVRDAQGCAATDTASISKRLSFALSDPVLMPAACTAATGALHIAPELGNQGGFFFDLDGGKVQENGIFEHVLAGQHTVTVRDTSGCTVRREVVVPAVCPVYIPNVFSPDAFGENGVFRIASGAFSALTVRRCCIFDRWGSLIFENQNYTLPSDLHQDWNGTCQGQPCVPGIYLYQVEIVLPDGTALYLTGTVLLVR